MSDTSSLPYPNDEKGSGERTPGDRKETRWEEVATTSGIIPAQILVGRLQAEGIPARAWQEGAGAAAGLVVGLLGMGHVMVPEEYAERALDILADEDDLADDEDEGEF